MAYRFSKTATDKEPVTEMTILYYKLRNKEKLTKEERERVASGLYGMGGTHSCVYMVSGWAFPFGEFLTRFIVKQHEHWQTYYAPSKTSLRKTLYGRLQEIHELPNPLRTI